MKFTLSWLKDHLDTSATVAELSAALDRIGLEVEGVEDAAARLKGFVVAKVVEAKQHPNADKLRLCLVDYGQLAKGGAAMQVVCGAPNAKTGLVGVFAPEGTYIPGKNITLTKGVIRGVESSGMMCSEAELELSDDHDGIIELPPERAADIGKPYAQVFGLDDPVFDIKVTANRPDAFSIRGIARDLAAVGLGTLKPERAGYSGKGAFPHGVKITLEFPKGEESACPAFASRMVRGVTNGPSPAWLQQRLRAIGQKPISALVDITNYVTFDRGRPLHVYDADKLQGTVRARLGKAGETFEALDKKAYAVTPEQTVIADDRAVLGLAGIIGGTATGCTAETKTVLIEAAWFDPVRTATTGRAHGIISDARTRFERGVDTQSLPMGVELATALILELCGGEPSTFVMAGEPPAVRAPIAFRPARVASLAGLDVPADESTRVLTALGFTVTKPKKAGDPLMVTAPTNRPDVHGEPDLVEEVIRIVGIDAVPLAPMSRVSGVARATLTEPQKRVRRTRRVLATRGLVEAITWSFITHEEAEAFGGGDVTLQLANPISSELSDMRPSLLPGLLAAVARNLDRGLGDHALFEVGQTYRGAEPEGQRMHAAAVRVGTAGPDGAGRSWSSKPRTVTAYDAKSDLGAVLAAAGLDINRLLLTRDAPAWFHPGRSGTVRLGPKLALGWFGELHPTAIARAGLTGTVVAFAVDMDALPAAKQRPTRAKPALTLADLQPVRRDFAFVLDRTVAASEVVKAAESVDRVLITAVSVFDQFEGGALGEGRKSLAIEVVMQPREKTLTDQDIEAVAGKIVASVKKATGGDIRG
jgi:phenylalanyl-tRNA synthetase beta chain